MIKLTLHLWSKQNPDQSDRLGSGSKMFERAPKKSFLIQWITSRSIDTKPTEHCWHCDAWCQHWSNDKVKNFDFRFLTLLMIKLTLYLWWSFTLINRWIRVWGPRCLGECQRKVSSCDRSHHGRPMPSRPSIVDIMMHDVNIEAKNKVRNFSFRFVTLLVIMLILHLWSKLHPDQSDGLGFEI